MSTPYFLTGLSIFFLLSSHHYSWKYCLTDTVTPPHYFPTHIISKTIFTHTHTLFPYCFLDGPAFWLYMGILCGLLGNLVVPWSPGLYFWSRGRLQKSSHTWQSWQRCPFISYHHPKLFHSQLTQLTPLQRPLIPHHDLKPFHSLTNHTSHLHPYFMKTSLFQELLYNVPSSHTMIWSPFTHSQITHLTYTLTSWKHHSSRNCFTSSFWSTQSTSPTLSLTTHSLTLWNHHLFRNRITSSLWTTQSTSHLSSYPSCRCLWYLLWLWGMLWDC